MSCPLRPFFSSAMQDSTAIARVSISIYHRGIAVREEGPREREREQCDGLFSWLHTELMERPSSSRRKKSNVFLLGDSWYFFFFFCCWWTTTSLYSPPRSCLAVYVCVLCCNIYDVSVTTKRAGEGIYGEREYRRPSLSHFVWALAIDEDVFGELRVQTSKTAGVPSDQHNPRALLRSLRFPYDQGTGRHSKFTHPAGRYHLYLSAERDAFHLLLSCNSLQSALRSLHENRRMTIVVCYLFLLFFFLSLSLFLAPLSMSVAWG